MRHGSPFDGSYISGQQFSAELLGFITFGAQGATRKASENKVTGLSEDMLDCLLLCSCDAAMAYPEDTPDKYEWEGEPARADETHDKYLWQQTLSCSGDLLVFCTNEIGV